MHKFLMNLDGDTWAFLQQYSKQSGRTVAGTIRVLVNDLREKELYGKDGLFSDNWEEDKEEFTFTDEKENG